MIRLGLAGDTMLGRGVAERLSEVPPRSLFGDALREVVADADVVIANLECCVSERGEPWPGRVFHFRAPPAAVDALTSLGVDIVTLANNHALDFGPDALLDTVDHLDAAGIAHTGAGEDLRAAQTPAAVDVDSVRIAVVGVTDHPAEYAATSTRPGVHHAPLERGVPRDLTDHIAGVVADVVVVTPHWGPNMVVTPVPHVVESARTFATTGAAVVAGHSAHVFHGVRTDLGPPILHDLGDFIDDYRVDPDLHNDRGLFWLVDIDGDRAVRIEAVPIDLSFAYTDLATGETAHWIRRRFRDLCRDMGTDVREEGGRLVIDL